jgi:hypothetical protein
LEVSNFYTPFPWLTINADFATSQARYNATNPAGPYALGGFYSFYLAFSHQLTERVMRRLRVKLTNISKLGCLMYREIPIGVRTPRPRVIISHCGGVIVFVIGDSLTTGGGQSGPSGCGAGRKKNGQ